MTKEQVAKIFLKAGLHFLVPYVGDVIVAAAEGVGDVLLDDHTSAEAKRISARLLKKIENGFVEFATVEGLEEPYAQALFEDAARIILAAPPSAREWTQGQFEPEQVANVYLERVAASLAEFEPEGRRFITLIIVNYHQLLASERDIVLKFEMDFRHAVLSGLANNPAAVIQALHQRAEKDSNAAAAALITIPRQKWRPGITPPAAILRADSEVAVPFHGRQRDLDELTSWVVSKGEIKVRLITGAGGMGKTRLLIETCARLADQGWRCGFLDYRATSISEAAFGLLACSGKLLAVIDYAETRREEISMLLRAALGSNGDYTLRLILLARSGGGWWDSLRTERYGVGDILSGPATSWIPLRSLSSSMDERKRSFVIALEHFGARLGRVSSHAEPDDLESEVYSGVLILHMKALAQVEGVPVKGEIGILDYILRRERHFWETRAGASGLPGHLLKGIGQAVTAVTLNGGVATETDAIDLFRRVRRLHDQTESVIATISDLLHEMYPGDGWIAPLLPDLLGEHLVSTELSGGDDEILGLVLDSGAK
jgi:hypothetical protein